MDGERRTILCEEIEARGSDLLMLVLYMMHAWCKMTYIKMASLSKIIYSVQDSSPASH